MSRSQPGAVVAPGWSGHLDNAGSRLILDLAAGIRIDPERQVTDDELTLASNHGLLGLMAVSDHRWIAEAARAPYARLAARQQAMERVLRRLLKNLAEAGIRATVVKGPALARWAYRDRRHRTFTDLDLLVPADQVAGALELLRNDPATVGIPPKTPRADKRNIPLVDASGVRFTLDLHWDLFSYTQFRGCADGAVQEGWERAVWQPDHDLGPMWRLPDEVLVSFLTAHAVLDHRFRLILFRDLAEVAQAGVDWDRLVDFSGRHGLRSTSYAAWHIAVKTVAAGIPASTLRALRPRSLPVAAMERLLPRTDVVQFDGHRPQLLNLAMVLLHDLRLSRVRLMLAAPVAFPEWLRRVEGGTRAQGKKATRTPRRTSIHASRVLHVLPVDIARGAQTYAKAMRDVLDSTEVEHRTATIFKSDAVSLDADVDLGVEQGLGRRWGFSLQALLRLREHIHRWDPDVVVAHGGEALKYAAFAMPSTSKLVYYKIGTARETLRHPIRRSFHRMLARRADVVAGVSDEMVTEARTLLGVPAERTVCIPNGRDPALFQEIADPSQCSPVRFLFVGHLTRTKRPQRFVDVIAALRTHGVDAHGVLVGDGPLFDGLRHPDRPGVEFLGSRDDVPALMARADVLLFTSMNEGEGMPGVLIEAGLAGLPVVSTDVPGARAVVEDGVSGYIVAADDLPTFQAAAERLAKDPDLRKQMGAAARQRCLERFTLVSSTEIWRRQLEDLLITPLR